MLRAIANSLSSHSVGTSAIPCSLITAVAHGTRSGTHIIATPLRASGCKSISFHHAGSKSQPSKAFTFIDGHFFSSQSRLSPCLSRVSRTPSAIRHVQSSASNHRVAPGPSLSARSTGFWTRSHQSLKSYKNAAVTPFNFSQHRNGQQVRGMASNALQRFAGNFSVSSSNKVVYTIVAINVAVFATWQYAEESAKRFRDGRLYHFMLKNFTDSAQNLREGRIWTLVTSAFSHKEWYHIILNSMVLLSFGDPVWRMLGTRRFLAVYLGSAVAASLSSVAYYTHIGPYLRKMQDKPRENSVHFSLGASGSLMGITTAFACVYPMSQYSLFFVINMPAAALIAVNTGRFDSAGHLGGGLFGVAYYLTRLRPLIRKMGRR
ncbi:hypothetical protein BG011_009295 [Mortierella polycephala]|uniref:Peptidase S54 rhomboid domain-containing protein n=1 Tax=Mortierella polycephala TaxID=41804 RepID=A0A9P6U7Q7_9FUNG|nr:hypothetical protein BG011_009295 [Mortierella polycephala]